MQSNMFPNEIATLNHKCLVSKTSPFFVLNPYGRGWIYSHSRKTLLSLPPRSDEESHRLTRAPAVDPHYLAPSSSNVADSQLTLASLRHEFSILRVTVRSVLYKYISCTRERATMPVELMGDLSAARVNRIARAFVHIGMDYADPIAIRTTPGRGHKS